MCFIKKNIKKAVQAILDKRNYGTDLQTHAIYVGKENKTEVMTQNKDFKI